MALGYWIKKDAITPEEHFDPATRTFNYVDRGVGRWTRGFMKRPFFNTWNFIYFLGSVVTTALGMYSSIEGLISAFSGTSAATSFGCTPPV